VRSDSNLLETSARFGYGPRGLVYCLVGGLALLAAVGSQTAGSRSALGSGGGGGEDQAARDWTGWLMAKPLGAWLVGAVGLGVIGAGLAFLKKGWNGDVTRYLSLEGDTRRWAVPLGRLGYGARGVVFAMIGVLVVLAAMHGNSSEVKGLGGALETLQAQPFGWVLLAITALGLFAFGVFGLVQARYRRIEAPDIGDAASAAPAAVRSLTR
jgi:hypothetical protein